jgi:hypothetical protein
MIVATSNFACCVHEFSGRFAILSISHSEHRFKHSKMSTYDSLISVDLADNLSDSRYLEVTLYPSVHLQTDLRNT